MLKKVLLFGLLTITIAVLAVWHWSSRPLYTDENAIDPVVLALNSTDKSGNPFKQGFIEANGHRLHFVEAGEGPAILFLHGFPSYWLSSIRQMQALKSNYRVIAIDGLGVGLSDAPSSVEAYRLEPMAEQLMTLLDELGEQSVHLVGHDWGGVFAGGLAQRYPDRVKSLTIMSAVPQNAFLKLLESSESAVEDFAYIETFKRAHLPLLAILGADKLVWEGAYQPLVGQGYLSEEEGEYFRRGTSELRRINAHLNWYRANFPSPGDIRDDHYWPSTSLAITQPTLFVYGTDDRISADVLSLMNDAADDLTVLKFEDVGHWPHVERAEDVSNAIRSLIQRTDFTLSAKQVNMGGRQ